MDIEKIINPWIESIKDPELFQKNLLENLMSGYNKTDYGSGKRDIGEFPVTNYETLKPHLNEVERGNFKSLLPEPSMFWAMTRGTTGKSKYIPITKKDLEEKLKCGPRTIFNYVLRKNRYDILEGITLNLNFPSVVGKMKDGKDCGYSSGIYAKYNAEKSKLKMIPEQEKIDSIGGIKKKDWEKRFELAYKEALGKNIKMVIGVTQVMTHFAAYLKKKYKKYPKSFWDIDLLVCTSSVGINTKLKPALKGLYGAEILEMYAATEGMYAQQLDRPYVTPNYDIYFFEVEVKNKIKMLYEMKKREIGKIIISSSLFPRYKIGDLIKCNGKNYFTAIGRDRRFTVLKHYVDSIFY